MGKIEWAMWANEQALASGLSEYENFIIMEGKEGGPYLACFLSYSVT